MARRITEQRQRYLQLLAVGQEVASGSARSRVFGQLCRGACDTLSEESRNRCHHRDDPHGGPNLSRL